MDELDSLFEGELASINEVFQEFEIKDKKKEERMRNEEQDLKKVSLKVCKSGRECASVVAIFKAV